MAFLEKVTLSGTAQSFLLYECINSCNGQEGFLIGDVTSEVTNHISDSQNDNARLDIQITIRSILPLPSVFLFYLPSGRIKESNLSDFLSKSANEVVGWYKYRRNTNIKPTFRDKLISKGLQKYFETNHGRKNFVTCMISSKTSICNSTHTFTYRFGKINCFNMYEYIEDVTGNLGEKVTGYKKTLKQSTSPGIFDVIVKESNIEEENMTDAILKIQEVIDKRLKQEAKLAMKTESSIRELEAEIKQMTAILSDRHKDELNTAHENLLLESKVNNEVEIAQACMEVLVNPLDTETSTYNYVLMSNNVLNDTKLINTSHQNTINKSRQDTSSPILEMNTEPPKMNYAAILKCSSNDLKASTSKATGDVEDLITFDIEDKKPCQKQIVVNEDSRLMEDSSPEY